MAPLSASPARPTFRPPPRRGQKLRARIAGGVVLVVLAALMMWAVVSLASQNPEQANLPGGDTFVVGEAERFAKRIAEQGEPIFFKDPLTAGAGREIYVLHDGDDPEEGWSAVLAYVNEDERKLECALRWDRSEEHFVDPCSDETYDTGDRSLVRYEARVNDDGKVEVDLKSRTSP